MVAMSQPIKNLDTCDIQYVHYAVEHRIYFVWYPQKPSYALDAIICTR
jgi:hypothetical protein